jgi:hypothetical protein
MKECENKCEEWNKHHSHGISSKPKKRSPWVEHWIYCPYCPGKLIDELNPIENYLKTHPVRSKNWKALKYINTQLKEINKRLEER